MCLCRERPCDCRPIQQRNDVNWSNCTWSPTSQWEGIELAMASQRVSKHLGKRPGPPVHATGRALSPAQFNQIALMTKRPPTPPLQAREQPTLGFRRHIAALAFGAFSRCGARSFQASSSRKPAPWAAQGHPWPHGVRGPLSVTQSTKRSDARGCDGGVRQELAQGVGHYDRKAKGTVWQLGLTLPA